MPATTGNALRLRKRELFKTLGYEPHEGQVLVHRSTAGRRVVACGTRYGKTKCGAYECVAALLEPRERALGWLVAPTYDVCRRIFDEVLTVFLEKLPHRVRKLDGVGHRIAVTNLAGGTSVLLAKSADKPASLLGEALDFLVVDEAARLKRDVWQSHLAPRLIDRHGWALLLSTPRGPGWFHDLYKLGQRGRDAGCESWSFPSTANPHIDASLIEAERARLTEETFAQEYLGQFLGVPHEACERCGGPREDASGEIEAPEGCYDESFLATCEECGIFVDADGRCLVHKANQWYASFSISRDWSDPQSLSMYSWEDYAGRGEFRPSPRGGRDERARE
jgi:hypothetical protein